MELGKRLIADALAGMAPDEMDDMVQHLLTFAFGLRAAPTMAAIAAVTIEAVPPAAMDAFAMIAAAKAASGTRAAA